MTAAQLQRRLTVLLKKTANATGLRPPGWWVGNKAGERRARDDMEAGRLAWRAAHGQARSGLEALSAGDLETAQLRAWAATDLYIEALEKRLRPSEFKRAWAAISTSWTPTKKIKSPRDFLPANTRQRCSTKPF